MTDTTIKQKKRKRVVIKESEWGRGTLCDINDMKCCLGFYALACGRKVNEIRDKGLLLSFHNLNHFSKKPSSKLKAMCLDRGFHIKPVFDLESIAIEFNDRSRGDSRRYSLEEALPVLRQCFKEAGFVFVYRSDL